MLGYPPRVLLKAVEKRAGAEAHARVRRTAGFAEDRRFRMTEDCSVDDIERLIDAVAEVLGMTRTAVEEYWVDVFFEDLVSRWPMWFKTSRSARELLELQPEIHNSFARATADPEARRAVIEKFNLETRPDETVVHYRSPHRLCRLYTLMARKVLAHYGDTADISESRCQHRGDPECQIHVRWS